MGRFRKTFTEALSEANELLKNDSNMTIEKAAKKAAFIYKENESQLVDALNGRHIEQKNNKEEKQNNEVTTKDIKTSGKKTTKTSAKNNSNKEKNKNENKVSNEVTKKTTKQSIKKVATSTKATNNGKTKFEYKGPVDIICLNGEVSSINICETIFAESKEKAKDMLYEKLFNNRLPIFINEKNWNKFLV